MRSNSGVKRILVVTAVTAVICTGLAWATASSGTTSTLIGPAATFEAFKFKMKSGKWTGRAATAGEWGVDIEARQGLDISTQTIVFPPGAHSGWHTHYGPVFISVKEGTMTFYDHNCVATVRMAGQGFLDTGVDPHLARNETGTQATNVVTYMTPPRPPALRIDAPQPPNCRL